MKYRYSKKTTTVKYLSLKERGNSDFER